MWRFAWRNLLTRPLRTTLALIGLSIPILGVIGLFSLSNAMRQLVGETLSRIQGVMVVREGALTPVFSDLDAAIEKHIWTIKDVTAVAPEVWKLAPPVEGLSITGRVLKDALGNLIKPETKAPPQLQSILDQPVIVGQDIKAHLNLKGAVFPKAILKGDAGGRFLEPQDRGQNRVVISTKIAKDHADAATGKAKRVGDKLDIGGHPFEIIGLYDTGSMFLDTVIIMDIEAARRLLNVKPDTVSSFYVECKDPSHNDDLALQIEQAIKGIDARSPNEIMTNFGGLMTQLDMFLMATVLLALLVGVIGIINTMLMSTTERFAEFGVLRTNGWSRTNLLTLVSAESAYLGLVSGVLGLVLAILFTLVANQFLTSTGLSLAITPEHAGRGLLLAVVMGTLGGLYPAWRASRMPPMAAIRIGAR